MSVCEHIHTYLVFLESVLPTPAGWASGQVYLPLTRFAWAFLEEEPAVLCHQPGPLCVGGSGPGSFEPLQVSTSCIWSVSRWD